MRNKLEMCSKDVNGDRKAVARNRKVGMEEMGNRREWNRKYEVFISH